MLLKTLAYTNFRARFFESRLDLPQAIFHFKKALQFEELHQSPKDLASVHYHLALLNFLQGNTMEAITFAQLCLKSTPVHKIAEAVLAWCSTIHEVIPSTADNTRIQMLLEHFCDESIPIIQALKNRHSIVNRPAAGRATTDSSAPLQKLWAENDQRLKDLQNIHKGERAFILGNGPSLSISDLDKLKKEITFASNKIYLAFDKTDWRPTYYSVVDHLVMKNNQEQIQHLKGPIKFFPFYLDCCPPPTDDQLIFFDVVEDYFPAEPGFGTNFIDGFYWGGTVTYSMIQMAFAMGIREVYLLGVDFSFEVPAMGNMAGKLVSQGEQNHFHPDYRLKGEIWNLPDLHLQEKSFQKAKKVFEHTKRSICNATRGGKLEVFPRDCPSSLR